MSGGGRVQMELHTKKVPPTIHDGADTPVVRSKKAPRHVDSVNCVSLKSAALMGQFLPPNAIVILISVLHAKNQSGIRLGSWVNVGRIRGRTHGMCSNLRNCPNQVTRQG